MILLPMTSSSGFQWRLASYGRTIALSVIFVLCTHTASAASSYGISRPPMHMLQPLPQILERQSTFGSTFGGSLPLIISNNCTDTVFPGITTQHGSTPETSGFELQPGKSRTITVSHDWQGRVWGRTNCTFDGTDTTRKACGTGDCAGALDCKIAGEPPVTLAEFTMLGNAETCFYDISLVDGFNIGMAIVLLSNGITRLQAVSPSKSNPSCVASIADFEDDWEPYASGQQAFLGSNSSFPLPFVTDVSREQINQWCPWDLQVSPPTKPADNVYHYPDDNLQRAVFQPCFSACAKNNKPQDCCTGLFNNPDVCTASEYSKKAKAICPDAYTFAYDDQDSTFTTASGAGFQIIMCPGGRSTAILKNSNGNTLAKRKVLANSNINGSSGGTKDKQTSLIFLLVGLQAWITAGLIGMVTT